MTTAANPPQAGLPESPVSEREIDSLIERLNELADGFETDGFIHHPKLLRQAALLLSSLKGRTTSDSALSQVTQGTEDRAARGDGWTEWSGGRCPFPKVVVRLRDGEEMEGCPNNFGWDHYGSGGDIVAYRVLPPPLPANAMSGSSEPNAGEGT